MLSLVFMFRLYQKSSKLDFVFLTFESLKILYGRLGELSLATYVIFHYSVFVTYESLWSSVSSNLESVGCANKKNCHPQFSFFELTRA